MADFASVEQPVGAGHRAEKYQRWLDDRGEQALLTHRQHRCHTAGYIEAGEDVGQLLVTRAGIDSVSDGSRGYGDEQGYPTTAHLGYLGGSSGEKPPPPTLPAVLTHVDRTGNGPKAP